jgi:hypothetical protein
VVTMKIDSTGVDVNRKSGIEPYEGPLPRPGVYAATIQSVKIRISQAGNPYFNVLFEFANQTSPEKNQFKGYPLWDKIVPGDSDIQKERVGKFINAICGKLTANILHDEVTDGGRVNKVGGKDPVGTKVRVTVRRGTYNGEPIVEVQDLFPWPKGEAWPEGDPESEPEDAEDAETEPEEEGEEPESTDEPEEEDEEDSEEEEDEEDEEDSDAEFQARSLSLQAMDRTTLKAELKGLDPAFKVLKRHTDEDLVNAILDLEYPEDDEAGGDEPPF